MVKTFLRYWIGDVFYNSLYFGHRFVVGFAHDPGEYHINMSIHYLIQSWFETIYYFIYCILPQSSVYQEISRNDPETPTLDPKQHFIVDPGKESRSSG